MKSKMNTFKMGRRAAVMNLTMMMCMIDDGIYMSCGGSR